MRDLDDSAVGAEPGESRKARVDRELRELLEEIRVALPGIEILLGFLLILPFSGRFEILGEVDRGLYLACFLITAMTTALFVSPTAHHRLGFRKVDKELLLRRANRHVLLGLGMLALAISTAAYLVASVVVGPPWSYLIAAAIAAWFAAWWYGLRPRPRS